MIRRWLELHDSTLNSVEVAGDALEVRFDGYVHQWESTPDGRVGTGWVMPVTLRLAEGSVVGHPVTPAGVVDGSVTVGSERLDNVIPLPFSAVDDVLLTVVLNSGACLKVLGSALEVMADLDQKRFVEELPEDLLPGAESG